MAISIEDIQKTIAGDGGELTDSVKATAAQLLKMFDDDVVGLKNTNAALKKEKTDIVAKWEADQAKYAEAEKSYQDQVKAFEEQLKNHDPDQSKKFYEGQVEILKQGYDSQLAELKKQISERDNTIAGYEQKALFNDMEAEFRKAAEKYRVAPEMQSILEYSILGDSGKNFAPIDTDSGRLYLSVDKSGDDIATRLDKFLKTPAGSRFKLFDSSGSGAEGGIGGKKMGAKTMSNEEFLRLAPAERKKRIDEGYKVI